MRSMSSTPQRCSLQWLKVRPFPLADQHIGVAWHAFSGAGGYRSGFFEKLLEAVQQLQDRPTAGQG